MEPRTGWLVFFFPRRGAVVPHVIAFGEVLGRLLRRRVLPRRAPHHVEGVVMLPDGPHLWGADANAGFIGRPAARRLAGLVQGRDFLVVGWPEDAVAESVMDAAVKELDGTPYENKLAVARVWRLGNRERGVAALFCSEAWARITARARPWARGLDFDNVDPLGLLEAALAGGGNRITRAVRWTPTSNGGPHVRP